MSLNTKAAVHQRNLKSIGVMVCIAILKSQLSLAWFFSDHGAALRSLIEEVTAMQKAKPRTPVPSFFPRKECLHRTVNVSSPGYIQVLVLALHSLLPGPAGLSNIPILPASNNLVELCHEVLLGRIGWEAEREMGSSHLLAFVSYCPRVKKKKKNKKRNQVNF